jgi:hypothetical protein
MVNQQLRDYVKQQTQLGVSKDALKSSLLGVGWSTADVTEVLGSPAAPASAPAAAAPGTPAAVSPSVAPGMSRIAPSSVFPSASPNISRGVSEPKTA